MKLTPEQRQYVKEARIETHESMPLEERADKEMDSDLGKTIHQLLQELYKECLNPLPSNTHETQEGKTVLQLQRLVGAQRKGMALSTVVAIHVASLHKKILNLTWALVVFTIVLAGLTVVLIWQTKSLIVLERLAKASEVTLAPTVVPPNSKPAVNNGPDTKTETKAASNTGNPIGPSPINPAR